MVLENLIADFKMRYFFPFCLLIIFSPVLLAANSLPTQAELDARLVGAHIPYFRKPMTALEVVEMDPACRAIGMGRINGKFWMGEMKRIGEAALLDRPEYAMAKNAVWFHHYCWGKLGRLRYFSSNSPQDKKSSLQRWLKDMGFIVKWISSNNIHWPYMYLVYDELSDAYFFNKDYVNAITEGRKALKENPNSIRAYARVADSYKAMGDEKHALKEVSEGLRHIPDSKPLQRRFKQLGGQLPYPEPYPKDTVSRHSSPSTETGGASSAKSDATTNKMPTETTQHAKGPTAASNQSGTGNEEGEASPDDTKQSIGKPGNPYCRFCPP